MDVFGGRPMLQAGALAAVMAVCGYCFNKTGKLVLALLLLAGLLVCLILLVRKNITPYRFFANTVVCLIGFGVLLGCFAYYDVGYLGSLHFTGEEREVRCEITDVCGAGAFYTDYEINIKSVDGEECDVNALLECNYVADLKRGDVAVFRGVSLKDALAFDEGYANPLSEGVFLKMISEESEDYVAVGSVGETVFSKMSSLGARLASRLENIIDGEAGVLASAMLLGDTAGVSSSARRDFSRAGVSHLFAISGLHLSIIATVVGTLLFWLGLGKGLRSVLLLGFIVFYLFLIDFPISAVRAAIMLGITYVSYLLEMSDDSLSSLGLAAWVILIVSPAAILDLGFVLSFCATLGILIVMPFLTEAFTKILRKNHFEMRLELEADPSRRGELNKRRKRFISFINAVNKVTSAVVVAFAVWMFMLLPVCYSVGTLSLASVPANLLLSPVAAAFILLSLFALVLGDVPIVGALVASGAEAVGEIILDITSAFSEIDHVMLSLRHDFVIPVVIASTALTVLLVSLKLRRRLIAVIPSYLGLAIVIIGVLTYNATADSVGVELISVGNNDAIVMTKGDGAVICDITSGSSSTLYSGFEIAAAHGATEVEALLLTHYHDRHVGAVGSFIQAKRVRRLYLPEPENVEDAEIMARLFRLAEREGVVCFTYGASDTLTAFDSIEISASGIKTPKGFYHPITSISIKDENQSFAYASSSCIAKEEAVDALVIGSHGPRPKPDGGFLLPRAKELYIVERELLDSVVRKGNIETYGRVFVDCDIVSLVFD